jgi:hypothetical protein
MVGKVPGNRFRRGWDRPAPRDEMCDVPVVGPSGACRDGGIEEAPNLWIEVTGLGGTVAGFGLVLRRRAWF